MNPTVAAQLAQLVQTWPGEPWTWDQRFRVVASSFTRELEPTARASAVQALSRGWTTSSIETAPASLRAISDRCGGLRSGQRLLAGAADDLYGLWWPWGGGAKITLRIGLAEATETEIQQFGAVFGL